MLTYIQINTAKPRAKEYALSDSQGSNGMAAARAYARSTIGIMPDMAFN